MRVEDICVECKVPDILEFFKQESPLSGGKGTITPEKKKEIEDRISNDANKFKGMWCVPGDYPSEGVPRSNPEMRPHRKAVKAIVKTLISKDSKLGWDDGYGAIYAPKTTWQKALDQYEKSQKEFHDSLGSIREHLFDESKMENFDSSEKVHAVITKDHIPSYKYDTIDNLKTFINKEGYFHEILVFKSKEDAMKEVSGKPAQPINLVRWYDFKPVITDGKKELVVDDGALLLEGKVVKKFDPKTTSLTDVVNMAQEILKSEKLKSTFKKFDDLKQALADAPAEIKESFNTVVKHFDEKSNLNVNFPKWMLTIGEDKYEVESDGSVKINGEKKDWKVSLTEPLQKILNIFATKHNEAKLSASPSLTLHDAMKGLKDLLFDAPAEIKQDFNTLVEYFDAPYKVMMHSHTGEHKIIKSEDESDYNHPWTRVFQGTEDKCKSYIKDHVY